MTADPPSLAPTKLVERSRVWYYKHKMNPQNPQQGYGYTPHNDDSHTQQPSPVPVATSAAAHATTQPTHTSNDPYDFILHPESSQGKLQPSNSPLKRVLVVLGFLVVLVIIIAVAANFLLPKDLTVSQMTTIAQEEQELVRVATFIASNARETELINFAVNTKMSVGTSQQATVAYLSTRKVALQSKQLALRYDAKTDTLFKAALASNSFDTTAIQTLNTQINEYKADIKVAYGATKSKKARAVLQDSYDTAVALSEQGTSLTK